VVASKTLTFGFVAEGFPPFIPLPFPTTLTARSIGFTWSVPSAGFTSVVVNPFPGADATDLLVDVGEVTGRQGRPHMLVNMSWAPGGPVRTMGQPRFPSVISLDKLLLAAEPGVNWWHMPGQSAVAIAGVIRMLVTFQGGLVPAINFTTEIRVTLP